MFYGTLQFNAKKESIPPEVKYKNDINKFNNKLFFRSSLSKYKLDSVKWVLQILEMFTKLLVWIN